MNTYANTASSSGYAPVNTILARCSSNPSSQGGSRGFTAIFKHETRLLMSQFNQIQSGVLKKRTAESFLWTKYVRIKANYVIEVQMLYQTHPWSKLYQTLFSTYFKQSSNKCSELNKSSLRSTTLPTMQNRLLAVLSDTQVC